MSWDETRESGHVCLPTSAGDAGWGASDSEGSFLRELRGLEPAHLLPVPGERLGGPEGRRYHILEWMAGGGMGQVFRAHDEVLQREVALKFLRSRPGFEAEALREARAVARLDHENIVRIFDVSEWQAVPDEPTIPFLVMECLEGEPLSALLKRGRLEVERALEVLDGLAAGLAHAHERGLVHRDLKPANLFLTRRGTVKLLDFGLSHPASVGCSPRQSREGTPAYMAPEQWRGEPQDVRTDIWAAGMVLYEMLTGELPFARGTCTAPREWVMSQEPMPSVCARDPEVPREVEAFLARALARDPSRRFPSVRELRRELRELRARLVHPVGREMREPTSRRTGLRAAHRMTLSAVVDHFTRALELLRSLSHRERVGVRVPDIAG